MKPSFFETVSIWLHYILGKYGRELKPPWVIARSGLILELQIDGQLIISSWLGAKGLQEYYINHLAMASCLLLSEILAFYHAVNIFCCQSFLCLYLQSSTKQTRSKHELRTFGSNMSSKKSSMPTVMDSTENMNLDKIITSYFRKQHALCKNPVVTCPPFSLYE